MGSKPLIKSWTINQFCVNFIKILMLDILMLS